MVRRRVARSSRRSRRSSCRSRALRTKSSPTFASAANRPISSSRAASSTSTPSAAAMASRANCTFRATSARMRSLSCRFSTSVLAISANSTTDMPLDCNSSAKEAKPRRARSSMSISGRSIFVSRTTADSASFSSASWRRWAASFSSRSRTSPCSCSRPSYSPWVLAKSSSSSGRRRSRISSMVALSVACCPARSSSSWSSGYWCSSVTVSSRLWPTRASSMAGV